MDIDRLLDRPGAECRKFFSARGGEYQVGCIPWAKNRIDGKVYFLFVRNPEDPPGMLIHGEVRAVSGDEDATSLMNGIVEKWEGVLR